MQMRAVRVVCNLIFHLINNGAARAQKLSLFLLASLLLFVSPSALAATPDSFQQQVSDGVTNLTANFTRFSNRGPNFQVVLQQDDGSLQTFTAPAVNTYIGTIVDRPGALATAVRLADDSVYYRVTFEDGTEWSFEGQLTEVLCDRDAFGTCAPIATTTFPGFAVSDGGAGSVLYGVEVGVDLPFHRYAEVHASDPADALALIEYSIMNTNGLYMREVGIQHQLGMVVIRASQSQDPYRQFRGQAGGNCGGDQHCNFLTEVENQWNNVLNSTTHDMALVVNESTGAGLAAVGVVANPRGYSSNDASPRGDFSRVFRHEGGHNWGLNHYDGSAPEGGSINSNNNLNRMSGPEQAIVVRYRNQQLASFDNLGNATVAMPPKAATDAVWVANSGDVLIDVLANDHDANGEALTLVSVNGASELSLGGSISLAPGEGAGGRDAVRYNRPNTSSTNTQFDRFQYRIRDASGLESVGYLFVRITGTEGDYSQDFNSFGDGIRDLGDGSVITDASETLSPIVQTQEQALRLTADQGGQHGAFTLPKLNLNGGFQASFRFKLSASGTPADGLVFHYGDPIPGEVNSSLGGYASGLSVEFNTFSRLGYVVRVNGVEATDGYRFEDSFANNTWRNVVVRLEASGLLTVTVDGTDIFTGLSTAGLNPQADDMISLSAKTGGFSHLTLIDDVTVSALSTATPNVAPVVSLSNSSLSFSDTNSLAGELVSLNGNATDSDGNLQTTEWIVSGQVVATGTSAAIDLPDGTTSVTFRATDSQGLTASTVLSVMVQAPALEAGWPAPFSGTAPSQSLGLSFNNIGFLNTTDGLIYSCLRIFEGGQPGSLNGIQEYDMAFSVLDAAAGLIQVVRTKAFNATQALASDGQLPSCSGVFELTTSEYSDTIDVGGTTYSARFRISDPALLQLQVVEATPLN